MKVTKTVDDLTGIEGETEEIAVTVGGKKTTLDLSAQSVAALSALVAQDPANPASKLFAAIFRSTAPVSSPAPGRRAGTGSRTGSGMNAETLAQIRSWAQGKGYEVKDRGRISEKIVEEWKAEHAA